MKKISLRKLSSLVHPYFLLGGFLLYALGVGVSHYLGHPVDWTAYVLGQVCVFFLQLSIIFLRDYFSNLLEVKPGDYKLEHQVSSSIVQTAEGEYRLTQQASLLSSVTALTCGVFFTVLLLRQGYLSPPALTIIVIDFMIALFFASPPIRLVDSGYGELTMAIFLSNLIPALAFILQAGNLHRLLAMTTFPLTVLYLASTMAFSLQDYLSDLKNGRRTLLIRLGWQRGMIIHNILVLVGFMLIVISITAGLPWRIAWPSLLALPIGLFQIWQMNQISEGVKPRWRLLSVTAMATFSLTAYFFAFSFWIS